MPAGRAGHFLDSNVVLYLLSHDSRKASIVERLLQARPVISVQVLNEVTHVCTRKLGMAWAEVADFLQLVRQFCRVVPISEEVHDSARRIAERYRLSFYDAAIAAAALRAGCRVLYTEDMAHGQHLEADLTILNPFREEGR